MNVLLLTPYPEAIVEPIKATGDTIRITMDKVFNTVWPDLIVSYGYRFIIQDLAIIEKFAGRMWNLHISLLPHGKGADPVKRAVLEGFPMGVTIHEIDEGVDTGPIVAQRRLDIGMRSRYGAYWDHPNSINDVYWVHREAIEDLFAEWWPGIRHLHWLASRSGEIASSAGVQTMNSVRHGA